jgi:hypothetical protein
VKWTEISGNADFCGNTSILSGSTTGNFLGTLICINCLENAIHQLVAKSRIVRFKIQLYQPLSQSIMIGIYSRVITILDTKYYCYMCEVSLVVALALLQQCNSTTLWRFLRYTTMLDGIGVIGG